MKIQSLSVCVPCKGRCVNDCRCCVSKMNDDDKLYKNQLEENLPFTDLYMKDFVRRLDFCRDNDCNVCMITGNCEPQQNLGFLKAFGDMLATMKDPFKWVEMQTTGVFLDNQKLRFLRNHVGVSTISVSTFSFDDTKNAEYLGNKTVNVRLEELCAAVKLYDFNLRLSVNLVDSFMEFAPEEILGKCKSLSADQVTFRHLYDDGSDSDQATWTRAHRTSVEYEDALDEFLKKRPTLRTLEYGSEVKSYDGMAVVFDRDCMAKGSVEDFKYLVVRPNGKLYSSWDDPASLIF